VYSGFWFNWVAGKALRGFIRKSLGGLIPGSGSRRSAPCVKTRFLKELSRPPPFLPAAARALFSIKPARPPITRASTRRAPHLRTSALLFYLALLAFLVVAPARAQTYYFTGNLPSVPEVSTTPVACDGDTIGAIRYNTATTAFEGCNGVAWADIRSGATATAAGSQGNIQFNSGGILGANANLTFTSTGRLGIGTTAPAQSLHVVGKAIATSGFYVDAGVANGMYLGGSDFLQFSAGGSVRASFHGNDLNLSSDTQRIVMGVSGDVVLTRDAAQTLASKNGTNAQQYNIYNTYTDATHYERAELNWIANANVFTIQTGKGSAGGTLRDISLQPTGGKVGIGTTTPGELLFVSGGNIATTGVYKVNGTTILAFPDKDTSSIAVGTTALSSQSATGLNNVAVGNRALTSNTTGSANTAVGYDALQTNTTGGANTALGFEALFNNTGPSNTAIGYGALLSNTTNGGNLAIGYQAGNLVTGSGNIMVGAYGNITTGSSNILIGNSLANTTATASNQLDIGDTIFGDISGKKVGINTGAATPGTALDVNGGVTIEPTTVTLTANNTVLATANRSYFQVTSDNTTETNRIFCFGAGTLGQVLVVEWTSSTNRGELISHGNCGGAAGAVPASISFTNWALHNAETILQLMYNGTHWIQIAGSANY
jgi:hypothetical protein